MIASWKDAVATVLSAAAVGVAWSAVAEWGWPATGSVRIAALLALVLGIGACAVGSVDSWNDDKDSRTWYQRMGSFLGAIAGFGALVAIVSGWEPALITCAAATTALWLFATVRHLTTRTPVAVG